jgi:hypothetical protein
MSDTKRELQTALPFAIEPVVYDFAINERGTWGEQLRGADAVMPREYYTLHVPRWLRSDPMSLSAVRRAELDKFESATRTRPEFTGVVQNLFDRLLPRLKAGEGRQQSLAELLEENGFDVVQHEQVRDDLRSGRIGLSQNRLPANADIRDARAEDLVNATGGLPDDLSRRGLKALENGELAVVTLAAGSGSRWTQGAGVVKGLHPFCKLGGRHRTFIETHLAKSQRTATQVGTPIPHILTTSWLTHEAIAQRLEQCDRYGYRGPLFLSPGRAIGLRMVPMVRDLRFLWEDTKQQVLDEQQQKVRDSLRSALMQWAGQAGEGSDYTDNLPSQCLHPVGHWFEIPNLLRNGVLSGLVAERPGLKHLLLHNIDTLGANADPAIFGLHLERGACLTVEVIGRRIEDRGGGLARVDGRLRLVEGLALPREEDEFRLSYYNSNSCWIDIDQLLAVFGLTRRQLSQPEVVTAAVRTVAARVPTYITIKDVKKRWGHGQEDIFPVAQWEKLWVDMTALPEVRSSFVAVPRVRGQQLKDQAQLDGWLRDGSAAYVESLCKWN